MPTLSVHKSRVHLQDFVFTSDQVVIGRGGDAQVQLESEAVSRRHVLIRQHPRGWIVEDTSSNGLFVNGEAVDKRALRDGDRIEFAQYVVIFTEIPHVLAGDLLAVDDDVSLPEGEVSQQQARRPTISQAVAPLPGSEPYGTPSPYGAPAVETAPPEAEDSGSLYDLVPDGEDVASQVDGGPGGAAKSQEIAPLLKPPADARTDKATAFLSPEEMQKLRDRIARRRGAHLAFLLKGQRREVELTEAEHFVGWSDECDVRLPGTKWLFKGAAWITLLPNGRHRIEADNFLRKVVIGRDPIKSHILSDGDVIRVGGLELRYHAAVDEAR